MSGSRTRSSTGDLVPRVYNGLRTPFASYVSDYLFGGKAPSYEGPLTVDLSQDEKDTIGRVTGEGRYAYGQGASREELLSTIMGKSPTFQADLDAAVGALSRDISTFAEDNDLATRALFGRAGQTLSESSPFARAQALNNRGYLDMLQKGSVGIRLPALMQERQNQLGAIESLASLEQGALDRELSILQVQSLPRLIADQGIERGIELFKEKEARILEMANIIKSLTSPIPQPSSHSSQGGVF